MAEKSKVKFYVLGASGFLGGSFCEYLHEKNVSFAVDRVDVTNLPALKDKFNVVKPEAVINFAGVRAYPNIDWCEDHKEETVAINVCGAANVMLAAIEAGAYPIQVASGCIYSGGPDVEFTEDDEPNFFGSFYSRMRIAMQNILKELPCLQLRIRMPISVKSHSRNLINKIVSYKRVISVPNSVTLIEDMFSAIEKLAELKPTGILNLTNDGYIEHKDILVAYRDIVDQNHSYELIGLEELEGGIVKAKRSNCVLSNKKLKSLGIEMPALDKKRLNELMNIYRKSLNI